MIKSFTNKYKQWNYLRKSKKTQVYSYKGVELKIMPGVFSPIGTITTELFAEFLLDFRWSGKKVLELGAGTGIIAFLLAQEGAYVTASDISENAIHGLISNKRDLNLDIQVVKSEFFNKVEDHYDVIVINPPFFNKNPIDISEKAWYCGENFEFFDVLFSQFSLRSSEHMWMILSERAQLRSIKAIASKYEVRLKKVYQVNTINEPHEILIFQN